MKVLRVFSSLDQFVTSETLDGREYVFEWRWSERARSWYFDLLNAQREVLLGGVRVVVNIELLATHKNQVLPPGLLVAFDLEGNKRDVENQSDLGDRVVVVYSPDGEVDLTVSNPLNILIETP
jgi:hypothetical protein